MRVLVGVLAVAALAVGCGGASDQGGAPLETPATEPPSSEPAPPASTPPAPEPTPREPGPPPSEPASSEPAPADPEPTPSEPEPPAPAPANTPPPVPPPPPPEEPPSPATETVLAGAGDIADDDPENAQTAALLERIDPDIVFTAGDNAYDDGSPSDFERFYAPTWGQFKAKTRPAPGNHDYRTSGAAGYFEYFGAAAGPPGMGYYSYEAGSWHVVVLNSNCSDVGGCHAGSPQEAWLRTDLEASGSVCTLAYWHHPRFTSGKYDDEDDYEAFWQALHDHGAEIVINGHDHNYQRYAPQSPTGAPDDERGIRQIIVGTGGKNTQPVDPPPVPNREVADGDTFGVLKLTLKSESYDWEFVPIDGSQFTDAGSGQCH